jgi:glutathione S-transferase
MILIGQFDSPFVRRVAIALEIYGFGYEHRPWSTFGNGELIAPYNPLRRVPTLVLDGGESLIESAAILDYLDELAGPAKALIPDAGPVRREALRVCALAKPTRSCSKRIVACIDRSCEAMRSAGSFPGYRPAVLAASVGGRTQRVPRYPMKPL